MGKSPSLGENAACKLTNVQFSISGRRLNPSQITACLRVSPTAAFSKGDQFGQGTRPTGIWSFNTKNEVDSTSTETHAIHLLKIFEPKIHELRILTTSQSLSMKISIWWEAIDYHGGLTLSSDTIKRMANICDEIDFFFISSETEK